MFEAIPYIGSGLALVAFIVAVSFYAYRETLRTQRDNVWHARPGEVDEVIATASEYIKVDISQLPENQRKDVVIRQLDIKAARESRKIWALVLCACMIAGLTALAILTFKPPSVGLVTIPRNSGSVSEKAAPVEDEKDTPSKPTLIPLEPFNMPTETRDASAPATPESSLASNQFAAAEVPNSSEYEMETEPGASPPADNEQVAAGLTDSSKWIFLGYYSVSGEWKGPRSNGLLGYSPEDIQGLDLALSVPANVRDGPFRVTAQKPNGCSFEESRITGQLESGTNIKVDEVIRLPGKCYGYVWARVTASAQ
jgi:hypothetical protein